MRTYVKYDQSPNQIKSALRLYQDIHSGILQLGQQRNAYGSWFANNTPVELFRAQAPFFNHEKVKPAFDAFTQLFGFHATTTDNNEVVKYLDSLDDQYYASRANIEAFMNEYMKGKSFL